MTIHPVSEIRILLEEMTRGVLVALALASGLVLIGGML